MKFRPCIDIHGGLVKQIVGGSLKETENRDRITSLVTENFVSGADASFYGNLYREKGLYGGHIILLDKSGSEAYEADLHQAGLALEAFPGGLQIGGGVTAANAERMLDMGATHVIVTSYVFSDGRINYDNLKSLVYMAGKEHLVLDLSCRKKDSSYCIVTDRWQKFTDMVLSKECMYELSEYCDEFLVHAVDVEGRGSGIDGDAAAILGQCSDLVTTYAGGISTYEDIALLERMGHSKVDFTIGSALDIFGGTISFDDVAEKYHG